MFVNRHAELEQLSRWWAKRTSRLAVVWGRRRVGKTALVRRFAEDKQCVFHTAAGRAERAELAVLAREVAALGRRTGTRDLLARPYSDWDDALDHLSDVAGDEPLLLVLDKLPELSATTPNLPNLLRAFLDRVDGTTKVRFILCGSAVRYMQALGEERQPLYGRADLRIQVHPFAPGEAALMLPELTPADRAAVYGLVGGVPLYLSWWDADASLAENLSELACQPGARLLTEGDLVLATEVEAGEYPQAVLHAIASGRTKHNEIRDVIRADPTRTLERLVALRLIDRLVPVTATGRTRRRIYRIADNFLAFHLGILSRFRGEIDAGLGPSILPVLLDSLDDHQGPAWEEAFRAHLRRLAARGELGEQIVAVGPYWTADNSVEIDAVAVAGRARTPVVVGEAKWATTVDGPRITTDVLRKAEHLPGTTTPPRVAIAARSEIRRPPPNVLTVTADDIFGELDPGR